KLFIDFSGDKLTYIERSTGEIIKCEVFIATLGYSNYTVAIATSTQKIEDVIKAMVKTLNCIRGVPSAIVPDNMKTAVIYPNRYEPVLNQLFLDMANHYGMAVLPARVGKPKDKAKVERAVNITYQRVFAPLRKRTFYSLEELNTAIGEQVTLLNERKMQQSNHSRLVLLEQDERSHLKPLPEVPYEIKRHLILSVQNNCHVYVSNQKKYYSVPYKFIGFKVQVIISSTLVHIYYHGDCVATHHSENKLKYNTNKDHLPSHHQIILNGTNEHTLREKAEKISLKVLEVIDRILKNSKHPEQAFKSCQAIMAIANKTSNQILHECCEIALHFNVCNYKQIQRLALGQYASREPIYQNQTSSNFTHENVRGSTNYK
ncbi:MAG TPA: IS21 family transposase, partial [Bacteroidia bacterium]|nr:IS21 family transposase [Bacteroidia bacterium]